MSDGHRYACERPRRPSRECPALAVRSVQTLGLLNICLRMCSHPSDAKGADSILGGFWSRPSRNALSSSIAMRRVQYSSSSTRSPNRMLNGMCSGKGSSLSSPVLSVHHPHDFVLLVWHQMQWDTFARSCLGFRVDRNVFLKSFDADRGTCSSCCVLRS